MVSEAVGPVILILHMRKSKPRKGTPLAASLPAGGGGAGVWNEAPGPAHVLAAPQRRVAFKLPAAVALSEVPRKLRLCDEPRYPKFLHIFFLEYQILIFYLLLNILYIRCLI